MSSKVLEIKNLKKLYGKFSAVDDLSLSLERGKILGLIGPNGAGKSTTIKCALGLLNKDEGEILYFNRNLDKNFEEIMKFVGYVPSENSLYENMKVIDFFRYANSFYEIDYYENILTLAQRLKLDIQQKISNLSLGMKRKVCIINALFHEPEVIILDEPTNSLDPMSKLEFEKILIEEKNNGKSILYSSHNLNEIQNICDDIVIIKDGKIVPDFNKKKLESSHKKVSIISKKILEPKFFNFDGIKDLEIEQSKAIFLYRGDIAYLIRKLDSMDLVDIEITNPNLEEVFLHYYK